MINLDKGIWRTFVVRVRLMRKGGAIVMNIAPLMRDAIGTSRVRRNVVVLLIVKSLLTTLIVMMQTSVKKGAGDTVGGSKEEWRDHRHKRDLNEERREHCRKGSLHKGRYSENRRNTQEEERCIHDHEEPRD